MDSHFWRNKLLLINCFSNYSLVLVGYWFVAECQFFFLLNGLPFLKNFSNHSGVDYWFVSICVWNGFRFCEENAYFPWCLMFLFPCPLTNLFDLLKIFQQTCLKIFQQTCCSTFFKNCGARPLSLQRLQFTSKLKKNDFIFRREKTTSKIIMFVKPVHPCRNDKYKKEMGWIEFWTVDSQIFQIQYPSNLHQRPLSQQDFSFSTVRPTSKIFFWTFCLEAKINKYF